MINQIELLRDDYKRRNATALEIINDDTSGILVKTRLEAKASCYRTIVAELDRILNNPK